MGSVIVNDVLAHYLVALLPFGGVKRSGLGRTHGELDLLQFTTTKSYLYGPPPLPFDPATMLRRPGNYKWLKTTIRVGFGASWRQRAEPLAELIAERDVPGLAGRAARAWVAAAVVAGALGIVRSRRQR